MANHCWNSVTITGEPDVLAKLEVLFNDYENHDYLVDWANNFFPNLENKPTSPGEYLFYGTRWWDFSCEMISDNTLQINGDSAWGPPTELIALISEHYQVNCEMSFSESGMDFAGVREWENGELIKGLDTSYSQHVYNEDGIEGIINQYLYDESCAEGYDTPAKFAIAMGIDPTGEEIQILVQRFKELKVPPKQDIISDLKEIETHLKNLSMYGLSDKVTKMIEILSVEWNEYLKENQNEQQD